jgi:hypothetical protein
MLRGKLKKRRNQSQVGFSMGILSSRAGSSNADVKPTAQISANSKSTLDGMHNHTATLRGRVPGAVRSYAASTRSSNADESVHRTPLAMPAPVANMPMPTNTASGTSVMGASDGHPRRTYVVAANSSTDTPDVNIQATARSEFAVSRSPESAGPRRTSFRKSSRLVRRSGGIPRLSHNLNIAGATRYATRPPASRNGGPGGRGGRRAQSGISTRPPHYIRMITTPRYVPDLDHVIDRWALLR